MSRRTLVRSLIMIALLLSFGSAFLAQQPLSSSAAPAKMLIGYMPYWKPDGSNQTRAAAAALDGRKFTHLYFAFFEVIQGVGCREYAAASNTADVIAGLKENKLENPGLKVVGVIGGYENSDGSGHFSAAVQSDADRQLVVDRCYDKLITQYGLDGIDVNWEHPAQYRDAAMTDLLRRFRLKLGAGRLLTVPLAATDYNGQKYPVEASGSYVDFWLIMALDFYGSWGARNVNFTSPLKCPSADGSETCSTTTTSGNKSGASVDYWNITRGIPRTKLLLSAAFYGLKYTGVTGGAPNSPYSGTSTSISYYALRTTGCGGKPCINADGSSAASGYARTYDGARGNPYLYNQGAGLWYGYDDRQSVRERADKVGALGLGGMWIWELNQDYSLELSGAACESPTFNCASASAPAATATRTTTAAAAAAATATRLPTSAPAAATTTRTPTPSSGTSAWVAGKYYGVGQLVSYGGLTYKCLQAHNSQTGWEPPNVPALWTKV
jgi:chitinase